MHVIKKTFLFFVKFLIEICEVMVYQFAYYKITKFHQNCSMKDFFLRMD